MPYFKKTTLNGHIYTWCNTQEIFEGQSNIWPTLVVPFPSDGVQTPQTKLIILFRFLLVNI
jgi:hypothetical protein